MYGEYSPSKWVAVRHRRPPKRPPPPPLVRSPFHSMLTFQFPKNPTSELPIGYRPTTTQPRPICQPANLLGTCESNPVEFEVESHSKYQLLCLNSVQSISDLTRKCLVVSKIQRLSQKPVPTFSEYQRLSQKVSQILRTSTTWPKA